MKSKRTHWNSMIDKLLLTLKSNRKAERKFIEETYADAVKEERERKRNKKDIIKIPKALY